jgi:SAM-dependent methyltransferase
MAKHWFERLADHMGEAYLKYSFTRGTQQEVDFLITALGLKPGMNLLDVGCGPGRHAHVFAGHGIKVHGIDISQTFIDVASTGASHGATFERVDARKMSYRSQFDAVVSLCQGAFGLSGNTKLPVPLDDPDGDILIRMAEALVPGGKIALTAFSSYFQIRYLEDSDTFFAEHGVNHERTLIRNMSQDEIEDDLWTSCFTPRELRLLVDKAGLSLQSMWSVSPGRYKEAPLTINEPEILLIAQR